MNGKNKCKLLKEIRQKIADENGIEYVTSECKFQGQCSGTCPKCEAEVRYLEQELENRKKAGKTVAVAGIAAAMVVTATGCDLFGTQMVGDVHRITVPTTEVHVEIDETHAPTGENTEKVGLLVGDVPYTETTEELILTGDVPYKETTKEFILPGYAPWPIP